MQEKSYCSYLCQGSCMFLPTADVNDFLGSQELDVTGDSTVW